MIQDRKREEAADKMIKKKFGFVHIVPVFPRKSSSVDDKARQQDVHPGACASSPVNVLQAHPIFVQLGWLLPLRNNLKR